jgi:Ca2+/Na+ antiporter
MTAGEGFVKAIKPIGCILFLILFVVFMVFCFTSEAPLGDKYTCPQTTEYYSEHLDEFEQELETNLLPLIDGIEDCRISGGKITIVISPDCFDASSQIIYHYYGKAIFDIQKSEK